MQFFFSQFIVIFKIENWKWKPVRLSVHSRNISDWYLDMVDALKRKIFLYGENKNLTEK